MAPRPLAVLGAGAWGTALAVIAGRHDHPVRLWGRDADHVAEVVRRRENAHRLPGVALPRSVAVTADLQEAVADGADILIAVPSAAFRGLVERLAGLLAPGQRLAWATKGLDAASGGPLHQVVESLLAPCPSLAVITGPSFAGEAARGLPTAVTVASRDPELAADLVSVFHDGRFRTYTTDDLVGAELGGAVKNVLAVATGIADGLELGANARAALITRGLAEIQRLGAAAGARAETLYGLAGVGDLILTCTDDQSRNRRFGLALGRGADPQAAAAEIGSTVEGVRTAAELHHMARAAGVELPICGEVHRFLAGETGLQEAIERLLLREAGAEFPGAGPG